MKVTYVSVGKDVLDRNALLHPVAANWWRLFVRIARRDLGVELEIIQAKGTYSGSANTHADGWAIDLRTYKFTNAKVLAIVALARRYGASATWYRTTVGSGPHIHLVVDAGPKTWTASSYQTAAVRAGYNGLGAGGRGGSDPHPKPPAWRTAAAGITAMTTSLTPTTTGGLSMSDINTILTRLDYQQAQLKAIAEGTYGRDALNARNRDVATIVKAATDAQSRVLIDAFGKLGIATVDMNALKTEMRKAVADALDGAVLEIKAGA